MKISARRITTIFGVIAFLLLTGSLLTQANVFFFERDFLGFGMFLGLLDMDSEISINNTFATLLLLFAGILLAFISLFKRQEKNGFAVHWTVLCVVFFYLAIDEGTALHDRLTPFIRDFLNAGGLFYQSWVILALVILIVLALYFFRFIINLPSRTRSGFLIAAFLYVGGALVLEMFAGRLEEIIGPDNFERVLFYSTEETLELMGLILFNYTLMRYLYERNPKLELTIKP